MTRIVPSEHCVFLIRAWRATPDSPWEFVLHRSGTNQTEYVCGQPELFSALSRQLYGEGQDHFGSDEVVHILSG
ncbi:MAG: hypothetical protein BroJett021_32880 [Chloroflexota bacterium]|jgi:hypothetical protein|nr:MAG: hypothetical protein BroJett021_32880 [Chloroflexota bacterium]